MTSSRSQTTPDGPDEVWDGLFHGCAWAAFVELAVAHGGPPPADAARQLAFRYYEEELARRNACHGVQPTADPPSFDKHPHPLYGC